MKNIFSGDWRAYVDGLSVSWKEQSKPECYWSTLHEKFLEVGSKLRKSLPE